MLLSILITLELPDEVGETTATLAGQNLSNEFQEICAKQGFDLYDDEVNVD